MPLLTWVQTFAVATGSVTLFGFLVSLPFSPARFWAWRLRKHMETVGAIDDDRFAPQRTALTDQATYLAARTAAAYAIPTNWTTVRYAIFVGGIGVGLVAGLVESWRRGQLTAQFLMSDPLMTFLVLPFAVILLAIDVHGFWLVFRHVRWERQRFMDEGCPEDFKRRFMPFGMSIGVARTGTINSPRRDRHRRDRHRRVKLRRKQLRVYRFMPPGIRPHNPLVAGAFWVRDKYRNGKRYLAFNARGLTGRFR